MYVLLLWNQCFVSDQNNVLIDDTSTLFMSLIVALLLCCLITYFSSCWSSSDPFYVQMITCLHFTLTSLLLFVSHDNPLPCPSALPIPIILFALFPFILASSHLILTPLSVLSHLSIHTYFVHAPAPMTLPTHFHRNSVIEMCYLWPCVYL